MSQFQMPPLARRQWLKAAAATGVLAPNLAAHATVAGALTAQRPSAVFDRRLSGGKAFAANAGALGLSSHGFEGDVSALWFGDLAQALAVPTGQWLVGHTALEPLVCLEQMAADLRHSVAVRIEHQAVPGGTEHHLTAPPAAMAGLRAWLESAVDWRNGLATALLAAAETGAYGRQIYAKTRTTGALPGMTSVSWLIAPTRRA